MKIKAIISLLAIIVVVSSCNVGQQVSGAYNMTQCKYDFNSISNLTLSGMDLSKGVSFTHIPQITSILSGRPSSVPMNLTLNLDVKNPNQSAAFLNGLQYILSIDDVQFTTGTLNQTLNIPAGGTQMLPLQIGLDLATLLKGESKDAVLNIAKNFIGIGNQPSNVTLQLRPTFMIGDRAIPSPVYIPVKFSFNGF